jgi:hypothetical protein
MLPQFAMEPDTVLHFCVEGDKRARPDPWGRCATANYDGEKPIRLPFPTPRQLALLLPVTAAPETSPEEKSNSHVMFLLNFGDELRRGWVRANSFIAMATGCF